MAEPAHRLRELHSEREVARRLDELAGAMADESLSPEPLLVIIAEGARWLGTRVAERLRKRSLEPESMTIRARRTVAGTELGDVTIDGFDSGRLRGRDVIVIDDIADEGRTLDVVLHAARAAEPARLRVAVLVSKRARRQVELPLDYVGFEVDDGWILGCGMDLDGAYRDLDWLAVLEQD